MGDAARADRIAAVSAPDLDFILTAQLAVAWAGEGGEEPRLAWWRSDLVSQYGGGDLFQRLLPHTFRWAMLQAAREAARRRDAECRAQHHDPDQLVSLFSLGFELDEHVDERLADLKRAGQPPEEALPALAGVIQETWDKGAFTRWLEGQGKVSYVVEPVGRRIKGAPPPQLRELVAQLLAALDPPAERYPLPHFRRGG